VLRHPCRDGMKWGAKPLYWNADFESARWAGTDLIFDAVTEMGTVRCLVRAQRLRDTVQRTGPEALSSNLPLLRSELAHRFTTSRPGDTVTLD
jgi:hypothetical protein